MSQVDQTLYLPIKPPVQDQGKVISVESDGSVQVLIAGRRWCCQRAASCLLLPEPGDLVLVHSSGMQLWLLAVLIRDCPTQPAQIHCEGELQIQATQAISLNSPQFNLTAGKGDCHVEEMKYSGKSLSAWISVSRFIGKRCESVWESLSQVSHRLMRRTIETEQVRAGQLDIKTSDFTRLHAPATFISSETLTRVDGKQIHIG